MEHRVRRRVVIEGEAPTPCDVILHEAALRMRYGGWRVAKAQLGYLLEAGEWPGMTIRVVPFTTDAFIGSAQAMLYASGPIARLDTVQLDSYNRGAFLDTAAQLDKYRAIYDALDRIALSSDESRASIKRIAQEL